MEKMNKKQEENQRTVLIVDDDPLIIRMYEHKLQGDGYKVGLASDGDTAYLKAKADHPDIILLDLMMPKMNGIDTLKLLKKDTETKDIPVIVSTNSGDDPAYIELIKEIGSPDYLVKSETSLKALSERVEKVISKFTQSSPAFSA